MAKKFFRKSAMRKFRKEMSILAQDSISRESLVLANRAVRVLKHSKLPAPVRMAATVGVYALVAYGAGRLFSAAGNLRPRPVFALR